MEEQTSVRGYGDNEIVAKTTAETPVGVDDENVDEVSVRFSAEEPQVIDLTDMPDEAQAETSRKAEADSTAKRVELKRLLRRRQRLIKLRQSLLMAVIILVFGVASYAISGLGIGRPVQHKTKAKVVDTALLEAERIYESFGTVGSTDLKLSLPAKLGDVICVGFHQAERKEAYGIVPIGNYLNKESTATVRGAFSRSKVPLLFVMESRGRGSPATSAMDVAMVPDALVYSPVDGVITKVVTYNLYNKVMDYHVEIQPDGHPEMRVAIIHIRDIQVSVGQRAVRRKTIIGRMRPLPEVSSQILKYLPSRADHIHIQVNPATVEGNIGS
ncbi:MAG: M23 family metallopeptidase [Firmicutes bacterium]|nr:M23 family metallopeptidase [Bacillota bacterium]